MPRRSFGILAFGMILSSPAVSLAKYIRHDVPVSYYETLAGRPEFAAAGYIYHNSIGFWHTGVLVAPDMVLTCAHAFDPDFTGIITRPLSEVYFGTSPNPFEGVTYTVTDVLLNPAWPQRPPEHDLALVKLDRPVEGVTPARLHAKNPQGLVGVSLGYGLQGDGLGQELSNTTAWRLAHQVAIDYFGPEDRKLIQAVGAPPEEANNVGITIRGDFDHPLGTNSSYGSPWPLEFEGGTATGDSGGPLFIPGPNNEWFVAGILFGGFNPYAEDADDSRYGNVSLWSPIASTTNQDFLRANNIPVVPEPPAIVSALIGLLCTSVICDMICRRKVVGHVSRCWIKVTPTA